MVLLRNQLAGLLDSFMGPEPQDLMGLMEILGDILHSLGTQGIGATSIRMAQHLLSLFEDVRAGAAAREPGAWPVGWKFLGGLWAASL